MNASIRYLLVLVPMVLIGLSASACIALYRTRSLSLPIPTVTATAAIILPLITGITLRSAQTLGGRGKTTFSGVAVVVFMLLVIYEAVLATLALGYMAPPSGLICGLERQWGTLYSDKNAEAIKRIQDRHQCCGLHSVLDKAWPFADKSHKATACQTAFDRHRWCLPGWRQDGQITGGLILLVAIGTFLLKLILIVINRSEILMFLSAARTTTLAEHGDDEHGVHHNTEGQPGYRSLGRIEGLYRDDPSLEHNEEGTNLEAGGQNDPQQADWGSVMRPSRLQNQHEED